MINSKLSVLVSRARSAKLKTGVGYLRQVYEILTLRGAPNFLGSSEYFDYGLFDPTVPMGAKQEFLGYKAEKIYSKLNQGSWHGTANDKIMFEQVMQSCGFKIPTTLALFHPWRTGSTSCHHVRTLAELGAFFADVTTFPLFVKPVHGLFGRGTMLVHGFNKDSQTVATDEDSSISLPNFFKWLTDNSRAGMLFQSMLVPSHDVQAVCGNRVSSVRMIVLVSDDGPKLFRANWKICTGKNIIDNTEGWTNGNIVAAVDPNSGWIEAAYQGIEGRRIPVGHHPDTKEKLTGRSVPNWGDMKLFVESCARAFPGLGFQAWDIAATTEGSCAIELNLATFHTVQATQLVSGKGFWDERLSKVLLG